MNWNVVFFDESVFAALMEMPEDIPAAFRRIVDLIKDRGIERMREP